MSFAIHIACRRPGLTRAELCKHIKNEIDFWDDHEPRFEPKADSLELGGQLWDKLDVHYDGDKLIQFWRADGNVIEGTVSEVIEQHLVERRDPKSNELVARLKETQLLITVRIGFGGDEVARSVWDMLSCVETCIAGDYDGVILAAEGIYDSRLEPLVRF